MKSKRKIKLAIGNTVLARGGRIHSNRSCGRGAGRRVGPDYQD
jgi:hypothetical protein